MNMAGKIQKAKIKRNVLIKKDYEEMVAKNLQLRYIKQILSERYFLNPFTVLQIARGTGNYKPE